MLNYKIDKSFIDSYLTCGSTYDNYIFENCPNEVIEFAYDCLSFFII